MSYFRSFACVLMALTACTETLGQAGVSSTAMGVGRAGLSRMNNHGGFMMPPPEMFRVEEFINYHRHRLPLPEDGARARLSVQHMNLPNGKSVYQFGITTPRALDPETMPPLNVVLVIDRSGSMSGDRLANVKKAIRAFIERFRESDKVTIVGFSNDARVHLEACEKTRYEEIAKALDSIHAGGGTNLHAGLMLGYSEALKHFDAERTNRVIFLTDGNANLGVTESEEISQQSKKCNQRGVSLTTIGLGVDFNHGLLRQLADAGRGVMHYVSDDRDIEKTFVSEIDSLLAPAARKVKLKISFGESTTVKIYGYSPVRKGSSYVLELDDLNHGATQVVIARLPNEQMSPDVGATLSYVDALTGEEIKMSCVVEEPVGPDPHHESIVRNYSIALVANALNRAAVASEQGNCPLAAKRLKNGIDRALKCVDDDPDKDVQRVLKIAKDYHREVLDCIARNRD